METDNQRNDLTVLLPPANLKGKTFACLKMPWHGRPIGLFIFGTNVGAGQGHETPQPRLIFKVKSKTHGVSTTTSAGDN